MISNPAPDESQDDAVGEDDFELIDDPKRPWRGDDAYEDKNRKVSAAFSEATKFNMCSTSLE